MPTFLDPQQTIHTCRESDCSNCDAADRVNCHFNARQLTYFLAAAAPIALVGGYGVFRFSPWALVIQVALYLSYFGFVEIRVMCSHCPHYGEPEIKSLKCWANYGSPTIWKYRPGPMNFAEKAVFLVGMAVVAFYPTVVSLMAGEIIIAVIYTVLMAGGISMLLTQLCVKCFNFACPFNRVDEETREIFFKHNPSVGEAWHRASD